MDTAPINLEPCISNKKRAEITMNIYSTSGLLAFFIFFLLFINDIVKEIGSNIRLFADATSLLIMLRILIQLQKLSILISGKYLDG